MNNNIVGTKIRATVRLIMKAVALGMGVCVVVMSAIGNTDTDTAIRLLGIGLACLGMAALTEKTDSAE